MFEKVSNIKFHQNPFSGSRVFPCGQTDEKTEIRTDGQTDITKLTIGFRNFASAPKMYLGLYVKCLIFYAIFTKTVVFCQIFLQGPNTKFYVIPSSESLADTCRETE
jgi:hypothetical protein